MPKHELMTMDEALAFWKNTILPLILADDPAILGLGVKPGDINTAGVSEYYRYVVEV